MPFDADAFAAKTDTIVIGGKSYEYPCDIPTEVRLKMLTLGHDAKSRIESTESEVEEMEAAFSLMKESIASIISIKNPDFDKSALDGYGDQTLSRILAALNGIDEDNPLVKLAMGEQQAAKPKQRKKKKSK